MASPPVAAVGKTKKKAAITRTQFLEAAPDFIDIDLGGIVVKARCKRFSSDSVGFGFNGPMRFPVKRGKMLTVSIAGQTLGSSDFEKGGGKSGNWRWSVNGKVVLPVVKDGNGTELEYQVGVNITASKTGTLAATTFDTEHTRNCMVGVNITAIGSKDVWEIGDEKVWAAWEKQQKEEEKGEQEEETPPPSEKKKSKKK